MEFNEKALKLEKNEVTITALNLKAWFYREVKNYTYTEIARELGVDARNVPTYVKRFKENYRVILNLTRSLGETPLVSRVKREHDLKSKIAQRREEGMHWGSAARGLEIVDKKLVASKNPEDVKLVQNLFQGIDQGKTLGQISRELNLTKRAASYMARNRNYRDIVIERGLFDRVQEKVKEWKYRWRLAYGILEYDENGDPIWDEEKKKEIVEAINERKDGNSWGEIAKKHGWPLSTAKKRIINPVYCGMQWRDGKLVKAHNKPIVPVKTWLAAMRVKPRQKGGVLKKELERDNRNKILGCFNTSDALGLTVPSIMRKTGLSRSAVKKHLRKLEKDGFIVNDQPFWRRKF